jgi:hypothetical protein
MVPFKRPKSNYEPHLWKILPVVCQCLIFNSKELVLLVVSHATVVTKTKGEIQVGIQKGHLAY